MKVIGVNFPGACEAITGRRPPRGKGTSLSAEERAKIDRENAARRAAQQQSDEDDRRTRRNAAARLWKSTQPMTGSLALRYLKSRHIDPKVIDTTQLRSHPDLWHVDGAKHPALVGRVAGPKGDGIGVWRIYLRADGMGKADVKNAKMGLGESAGGAVRIGGIAAEIGIAEGIETALACRQMVFADTGRLMPVWASLSTSGMRSVELPPEIQSVRIYADADFEKLAKGKGKPSPGFEAAKTLAERLKGEGRRVVTSIPSPGNDWNDDLRATEEAA